MSRKLFFIILIIFTALAILFALIITKNNQQIVPNNMTTQSQSKIIRQPAVAGQFYPADKNELSAMIDEFLVSAATADITGQPQILIVPHAGYVFSGKTAAYGFKTLENHEYETVIILGSSHNYPLDKLALYNGDAISTPLGEVEVDKKTITALVANNQNIFIDNDIHKPEHSLEVEIPFLQKVLKPIWQVILGLINTNDNATLKSIATTLASQITPNTLIVISSDLSHYPSDKDALYSDTKILNAIITKDTAILEKTISQIATENLPGLQTCACGESAIKIGLLLADKLNLTGKILHYANSGNIPEYGDKDRVVGYGAIVLAGLTNESVGAIHELPPQFLMTDEQNSALALARHTLELAFGLTKNKSDDYKKYPIFSEKRGVFVTLKKGDELRGCIGLVEPIKELGPAIIEMAEASAFEDPRFLSLEKSELNNITIEISVLTPPQKISDPQKEIELGHHGVIVKQGSRSGVFLPQVATETGWGLEEFMGQLCSQKAGLPTDCWHNGSADIYTFEAQVFEEE